MPAGLDGNPDPVVTPARSAVLDAVADRVERAGSGRVLVGVDGRSGVGKSTFADELARVLEGLGRTVIRSTTDLFHRPRLERMALGATSPEGYVDHSHQIGTIVDELLVPFRRGASEVLVGAFDEPSDRPQPITAAVPATAILVFDGLFVHRQELLDHWDLTLMLHADRRCDAGWLAYLETDLPQDPTERAAELDRRLERARWPRYRHGWRRYLESVGPAGATIDIDNEDLTAPVISSRSPLDGGNPDRGSGPHPSTAGLETRTVIICGDCAAFWDPAAEAPACADAAHEHHRFDSHLHRTPVAFRDGTTVTAVSFGSADPYARRVAPAYGLYLDERWQPLWPHQHLDWPDFGVPDDPAPVRNALEDLRRRALAGEPVEIGCYGAHGRTGTALACMAILCGEEPDEAVAWVRASYCERAVETELQETFVRSFVA